MIDERIEERRRGVREDRRRARLRRTLLVAAAVVVVAALAALEASPLVALEEIRVEGTERLDDEEVRATTGLEPGTSTLRLRLGRVEQRVEELPEVRTVDARRLDPLTVLVEVTEREPALVVEDGDRAVLVDRDGVVLATGATDGLPRIVVDDDAPDVGATVEASPAVENAHRAWRELSGPLRSQVVRYEAEGPDELVLVLDTGIDVRFGRAERMDEKIRALGAILEDVGDAEITVIDVRAPSAPVVVR